MWNIKLQGYARIIVILPGNGAEGQNGPFPTRARYFKGCTGF